MIKDERVISIIRISTIEKAIDECKCPEPMFCTIATTCTTCHERERACLKCWLAYCQRNNIEIDYEEN